MIIGANGNNFSYGGDMLRRGLTGRLDTAEEKPWERVFDSGDPVIVFKRERPKLVAAAHRDARLHCSRPARSGGATARRA